MKKQKGFTLIELLIVIAIIGIIAAIAIPNLLNALDRSRQKRSQADLRTWGSALGTYLVDWNFYPFDPTGPDAPIGPGVFLYDEFQADKYLESAPYQDGWNNVFRYTGGTDMISAWGYTICSLGKGNISETGGPPKFRCFQCDIRLRNGQFFMRPEGPQTDNIIGCVPTAPCI
ncbi:MAG: hypothetical protein A2Y62_06720 [Candidatus Fischerbacteria bacterium RBG_13_37_8]|uniref:Type II secretion system protein GspG C-terminal domain-containing protein n=1 Tax=Candidatus Fischerbacteria bacterium RBG_13_37_8 TaxID=1817863 RepID=A0A1F5VM78_9BACT|nr:MAG: hypothetical protein A2Y62_06720 [Candidatus Fischerbacteria bacterium RBG_13_37_8]